MTKIIRNGKAYDSADASVYINGITVDATKLEYGNEQEHQLNYTLGANASSWSMGKVKPNASIGLPMHVSVPIEIAGGGSLLRAKPFVITVEFVNEYNIIVVDKIIAKFQSEGRSVTGDMGLEKDYDLFALEVDLNVNNKS